ncbi:response regulator [uncultured Thiodictyon sp.]|uniref:response regulator n=1 Tax=uncultured Thiodictyon sp. TaxID=1846217 RepID=UPI0025D779C1|nr:response regulator [uncultured Thiodictyon sp.]
MDHVTQLLVVDDDPVSLAVIAEFLRDADCALTCAADGIEAWERLDAEPARFDALILDRLMPRLDGIALTRRVVSDPRFEDLPIIMQTAANGAEDVAAGLAAGVWHYLAKPYAAQALRRALTAALEDRHNRQELRRLRAQTAITRVPLYEGRLRFRDIEQARALAAQLGNLSPRPFQVSMGLAELMINAVEHGNLAIGYQRKGELLEQGGWLEEIERRLEDPTLGGRWAEVKLTREPHCLRFAVRDEGAGFDWVPYLELNGERAFDIHGRGIAMARRLAFDRLDYQGSGNLVLATVSVAPPTRGQA